MSVLLKDIEVILPTSHEHWLELRKKDLTSTEISTLFGCNPYMTAYELWHSKKGLLSDSFKANDRMTWGTRLQDSIAKGVSEDNNWLIKEKKEYIRRAKLRLGSSFDFVIVSDYGDEEAILEIKNVDSLAFKNGWIEHEDGSLECPLNIEMQVQHQMIVSGIHKAYVAALIGGNRAVILEREIDWEIEKRIIQKAREFWHTIDKNIKPEPDFSRDAEAIKELYLDVKKNKAIEAPSNFNSLAERYSFLSEQISIMTKEKEKIKSQALVLMGDAEKMVGQNFSVSAGLVQKGEYTVKPSSYRNFRITFKDN